MVCIIFASPHVQKIVILIRDLVRFGQKWVLFCPAIVAFLMGVLHINDQLHPLRFGRNLGFETSHASGFFVFWRFRIRL